MTKTCLHIYLNDFARNAVAAGQPGMILQVKQTVEAAGWQVLLLPERDDWLAPARPGFHLVVNRETNAPNTLVLRQSYLPPFWQIETTNDRWNWQIARQTFPDSPPDAETRRFQIYWRGQIFGTQPIDRRGYIFAPLQGRLLEQRSFQAIQPLQMLKTALRHWPDRPVIATLHPKESYSAKERSSLAAIAAKFLNLSLSTQPMTELLAGCDLVVTQNSGAAIKGMFADKPALLFAQIDFHHIAASVPRDGKRAALAQAKTAQIRDYSPYLHWFFKQNMLNVRAKDVQTQIHNRLRSFGWPI